LRVDGLSLRVVERLSRGLTDDKGYVLFERDRHGDVVATSSAKWLDWSQSNFKIEAESLRFFYSNPERDQAPGESCVVTALDATKITGRVLHTGGAWYRPDMRGRQLAWIIPRTGRADAGMRWVTMTTSPSYPDKDVKLVIVGLASDQMFEDSADFLANFGAEIYSAVSARRA
jgi:hypothetical protein